MILFSADFAGSLFETLCTQIGADKNLMRSHLLRRSDEIGGNMAAKTLHRSRKFLLGTDAPDGSEALLICKSTEIMDVDIHF